MIGESVVPRVHVAPALSSAKIRWMRSANSSAIERSTSRREPALHTCPALPEIAPAMRSATSSSRGRIGEYDLRALAAQFERHRLGAGLGAGSHDRGAGARRSGERHLADARMTHERVAGHAAVALHHIEDALRHARLDREFGEPQAPRTVSSPRASARPRCPPRAPARSSTTPSRAENSTERSRRSRRTARRSSCRDDRDRSPSLRRRACRRTPRKSECPQP